MAPEEEFGLPCRRIETIEIRAVGDYYRTAEFRILKLELGLDVSRLSRILDEVIYRFELVEKDGLSDYRAICLQYADASEPLYGAVASMLCKDANPRQRSRSCHRNDVGDLFGFVFERLLPLRPIHGRILLGRPGLRLRPHRDYFPTLHIPIVTHERALLCVDGETFHLAADGSAYIVNSVLEHYMENRSNVDRYHLSFYLDRLSVFPDEATQVQYCVR